MDCRTVAQEKADFFQFDQLPDGPVTDAEVTQKLESLGYDLLRASPVLQVGDYLLDDHR